MKKLFLIVLAIAGFSFSTSAQSMSENALGLRLGDSDGFGAEISYQRALTQDTRLEFGLGWRNNRIAGFDTDAIRIVGLHQWVWHLDGSFNWYAGFGGGFASYNIDAPNIDNETALFLAGNVGIEYDFDIPLLISLDFRPEFGFGDFNNDADFDIALGLRYQF